MWCFITSIHIIDASHFLGETDYSILLIWNILFLSPLTTEKLVIIFQLFSVFFPWAQNSWHHHKETGFLDHIWNNVSVSNWASIHLNYYDVFIERIVTYSVLSTNYESVCNCVSIRLMLTITACGRLPYINFENLERIIKRPRLYTVTSYLEIYLASQCKSLLEREKSFRVLYSEKLLNNGSRKPGNKCGYIWRSQEVLFIYLVS